MQGFSRLLALGVISAAALAITAPSHAATIASFSTTTAKDNVKWKKTGPTSGFLHSTLIDGTLGSVRVAFTFADTSLGDGLRALFTLSATEAGSAASGSGVLLDQGGLAGSFSFIYLGPN